MIVNACNYGEDFWSEAYGYNLQYVYGGKSDWILYYVLQFKHFASKYLIIKYIYHKQWGKSCKQKRQ